MPVRILSETEQPHTPSLTEDVVKSSGTGQLEGWSSLIGSPGDVRALAEGGLAKLADLAGMKGVKPHIPVPAGVRETSMAMTGLANLAHLDPRVARLVAAVTTPGGLGAAPTSSEVLGAATRDKPLYQPQTKAGAYARTINQFTPASLAPGGAVRRAANVVVPAVASEAAGQATKGTPAEPYARIVAALAAGGGVALAGRGGPDTRLLAEASRGATDQQIAGARALMADAEQRGVRLTMAEALQQVTNGATGMGRMQRVVEGTPAGNERVAPVMAERPAQTRAALQGYADTIAPPTNQPSMVGAAASESADHALTGVRQEINAQARPYYENLPWIEIGDQPYEPLLTNPAYTEALAAVRGNRVLGPPLEHLSDRNASVINEVVKHLDTQAENARPGPMNPGGNNQLSAAYGNAAGQARAIMEQFVPEWSQARDTISQGRAARLAPLQRGPLGAIAGADDIGQQTRALFPAQPSEGAPAETATALQMLGGPVSDPGRGLVRQHLMNSANEATQDLQSGPNQWGGARWAATQMGNPEQAATLEAGVGAVGGDVDNLRRLAEVLRATGRREQPGSMTAYNTRALEELGKAGVVGEGLRTGLNPPGIFRRFGQGFQDWQTERNAGRLAEAILASPDEAQRILLHARAVVPRGQGLETIERLALAAQEARRPEQEAVNAPPR